LHELAADGIAVASHGATHRPLTRLAPAELEAEIAGSAERLRSLGLPPPRAFCYPHGEWSPEIRGAVRAAGYAAAFTTRPGALRRSDDRYALPRIEVHAGDTPRLLALKVASAGWPDSRRARLWRLADRLLSRP
jgi:peptidoglycan/xylan/chitin deacetylase (PgdA/CDA1 family)